MARTQNIEQDEQSTAPGLGRRQVLGASLVGGTAVALAACSGDESDGGSAGGKNGGKKGGKNGGKKDEKSDPSADGVIDALPDVKDQVADLEMADIGAVLGAKISVPRSKAARGISEAADIVVNKVLRETVLRKADPKATAISGRMFVSGAAVLGMVLDVTDDEGRWPAVLYYDAKGDRPYTSPELIDPGQWSAFTDAVSQAAQKAGGDAAKAKELCREQPRPWGNGPSIVPGEGGALNVLFPTLEGAALVTLPGESAANFLSEFGTAIVEAAGAAAAFDVKGVAVPSPDDVNGNKLYELPEQIWKAEKARTSEGPGPRTQLAPLAEEGTRPSSVAAPDGARLKTLSLTFDDGPDPHLNEPLRKALKEKGAAATFFMIGKNVAEWSDVVTATALDGFEVGCHSWSHPQLTRCSEEKLKKELGQTTEVIGKAIGRLPFLMRPPYGARNKHTDQKCGGYGQSVQIWDVDSLDWKNRNVQKNMEEIRKYSRRGSLVLMHEIHKASVDTVPGALDFFAENNFTLLTTSELGQNQMYAGKHYMHGLVTKKEKSPEGGSDGKSDGGKDGKKSEGKSGQDSGNGNG